MWLFVMFDLPVETGEQRRRATRFRKDLLDLGFEMSQFSIYLKYCASSDKAESISRRVQGKVSPEGKVDVLTHHHGQAIREHPPLLRRRKEKKC